MRVGIRLTLGLVASVTVGVRARAKVSVMVTVRVRVRVLRFERTVTVMGAVRETGHMRSQDNVRSVGCRV